MPTINPYLTFDGQTKEAFEFYKSVFGGEFEMISTFRDMPGAEQQFAADEMDRIMHVALPIGDNILMGSDSSPSMGQSIDIGNHLSVSIQTDSREETDRIFTALSEEGDITMPLEDTFWNAYFGMCNDKFGVHWMVNYDYAEA